MSYDPKTYDETEVPFADRKYMSFHGTSFHKTKDKAQITVVGDEAINDDNGYDAKEIFRIHNLYLGEAWKSNDYSDHCIVRIQ